MAAIDLPLAELERYLGTNPCPDDFDAFWQAGLAQMRAIDPAIETKRVPFEVSYADCFDLTFTGVGGARIYAKLLKPKQVVSPMPALLEFHGYTGQSGDWFTKLPYVANGMVVVSLDCRGQGGRSEDVGGVKGNTLIGHLVTGLDDTPDKMLFRQVFLDTAQLAGIVMDMPDVDASRVGATGESQGGGLTLACAALEPRIKRIAPVFPFLSDYQRCWELDLETAPYDELKAYFRRFDPLHEQQDNLFQQLGYIDVHHHAKRIKAQTLMAATLRDDICPPSTQFAAYNNLPGSKELCLYHDYGHERLPGANDRIFQFLTTI